MKELIGKKLKAVVIGDAFVKPSWIADALKKSKLEFSGITELFWGTDDKEQFTSRQLKVERDGPEAVPYAEGLEEAIRDADLVVTHFNPLPKGVIARGENLKAVFTCRGGLEHICLEETKTRGIPVVNIIRNAEPVADFTLGMILSLTRNIAQSHHKIRTGVWQKEFFNSEYLMNLDSHTVGLIGTGNIGILLARKLLALDVPVMAYDAFMPREEMEKQLPGIQTAESMEQLLAGSDIVSVHLRLTEETKGAINLDCFRKMKKTAYFVNTARGGLVNQKDLIYALENGIISGAALDVFEKEPLEEESPLVRMDNVILTPHIAGTTVDAIPKSPYMLMKKVDGMLERSLL